MTRIYVPAYDGLRFLLLLGVLEFHYLFDSLPLSRIWFLTYCLGCFFSLSGFLITHLLVASQNSPIRPARPQILWNFYVRRGLRIFPAYYFILFTAAATLGVPYLAWHSTYLFNCKLFSLSLAPTSREFLSYLNGWERNGIHLWSMAVEEQFYLLFPLLLIFTPPARRSTALAVGIGLCMGCRLWLAGHYPHSYYGALLPVAGEYLLWGSLLAWLDLHGQSPWLRHRGLFWGSTLALLAMFALDHDIQRYQAAQWHPPLHMTLYALFLSLFILGLKHHPQAWLTRTLSWGPFTRLGKISYSAYLVHLFLNPLLDRFPSLPRPWVGPILALAVSALIWVTFEERINRAKDRWAPSGSARRDL